MEAKAVGKYIRIAPRKARAVTDIIRGKHVDEATMMLKFSNRAATSNTVAKVLESAVANARHNEGIHDDLYVTKAFVDQGPTLKRFRPRAMGRASRINKRTSHITIYVGTKEEAPAYGSKG